jgi:integrase
MRIGDFYSLTTANIVNGAIEYIPGKTLHESGRVARIPLRARAKEIIERYKGGLGLLPFISQQKYNKAIKEMLRIAGINRVVTVLNPTTRLEEQRPIYEVASSHMARRNFIGILYASVKDPDLISSMTGHVEGSKAFARYRTIDDNIKKEVLSAFDDENDNDSKNKI